MLELAATYVLAALCAPLLFRALRRRLFYIAAIVPTAAAMWFASLAPEVFTLAHGGQPVYIEWLWHWVPSLELDLVFRLDGLSWLLVMIINIACALILLYCVAYFPPRAPGLGRFSALFLGFAFSMNGLVLSDHTLVLYVFWEFTALFSYLLIGHHFTRRLARASARQAFLTTSVGSLAMFGGFFLLRFPAGGSFRLSEIIDNFMRGILNPSSPYVVTAVVLIVLGAMTKSAMVPFHFWLPAAMAAPTPVSAFLHAASMVKAGIYLIARLSPAFVMVPGFRIVVFVGLATMLVGAYRALRQNDLKLILAYGTVSQLGFMMALAAWGTPVTQMATALVLLAHATFKSALFLSTGTVEKLTHTRDISELSGVGRKHPVLATAAALAAASMAGVPITVGYLGKESVLHAFVHGDIWMVITLAGIVIGSIFTTAYSLRWWWGAFGKQVRSEDTDEEVTPAKTAPSEIFLIAIPLTLSALSVVLGWIPQLIERVVTPIATAGFVREIPANPVAPTKANEAVIAHDSHSLAMKSATEAASLSADLHVSWWSGVIPAVLTAVILALGLAMFIGRLWVGRLQRQIAFPQKFSAANIYLVFIRDLETYSAKVVSIIQRGSLPYDLSTIILTLLAVTSLAALWGDIHLDQTVYIADFWTQLALAVVAITGAVLTVIAHRRITAAISLGVTGAAIAIVFLTFGGPDLALTQLVVEAVTLVIFVLVFRRLPAFFSQRQLWGARAARILIAVGSGLGIILLGLVVTQARQHMPVSYLLPEEVKEFGEGNNIVNVILVDVRAWDTVGELTVLLIAALGVTSLIYMRAISVYLNTSRQQRRVHLAKQVRSQMKKTRTQIQRRKDLTYRSGAESSWLQGVRALPIEQRSVIMEVSVRILFHTLMLVSVWVLLIGHNNPGGGFIAGMTAGIALTVRYIAGGRFELFDAAPFKPGIVLGLGLFIAAGAGVTPVLAGLAPFQTMPVHIDMGWAGSLHFTTAIFLDIGVYLVVMGVVLDVLSALGSEVDRHCESMEASGAGAMAGAGGVFVAESGADKPGRGSSTKSGEESGDKHIRNSSKEMKGVQR